MTINFIRNPKKGGKPPKDIKSKTSITLSKALILFRPCVKLLALFLLRISTIPSKR